MEYLDNELTYLIKDNNEVAQDLLYDKYKFIIDSILNKYKRVFYALNIELEEVRQEANLAFSYAIYNYDEKKDASLNTFITLCVERKVRKVIKSKETMKSKVQSETISLNNNDKLDIENLYGDETYEPSKKIENIDMLKYINKKVKDLLSQKELEVYNLLLQGLTYQEIAIALNKTPKQIDNTIQRIRIKLKKLE
mgnify:CR=1 FL=1